MIIFNIFYNYEYSIIMNTLPINILAVCQIIRRCSFWNLIKYKSLNEPLKKYLVPNWFNPKRLQLKIYPSKILFYFHLFFLFSSEGFEKGEERREDRFRNRTNCWEFEIWNHDRQICAGLSGQHLNLAE